MNNKVHKELDLVNMDQDLEQSHLQQDDATHLISAEQQSVVAARLRVIQLFMSGRKLKNLDTGRDKSDTFCVLKMKWTAD